MKKFILFAVFAFMVTSMLSAQSNATSLEGIYLQPGTTIGLKVDKLPDGNYLFTYMFMNVKNEIVLHEWQTAYVVDTGGPKYMFYWHGGREFSDDPTTNYLMVYELTFDGRSFRGTLYFPTSPLMPKAPVTFTRK